MRKLIALSASLLATATLLAACGDDQQTPLTATSRQPFLTLSGQQPLILAHRGASGLRPEHTVEGYALAIQQGADFVEPDLVLTKDGVMIARHEPMLDGTTDVAKKFPASRRTTKKLDGVDTTAYFASDFTLAEIKTLRAIQPSASRNQQFNGLYTIPTLDEVIMTVKAESTRVGRTVGIYPEIKHSYFHSTVLGFGANVFEDKLVAAVHAAYGNSDTSPVFIQSFESANLRYLNTKTNTRLIQLIDANDVNADGSLDLTAPYDRPFDFTVAGDRRTFADLLTSSGLDFIKTYADGIGPWKPYLLKTVADGVDRTGDGVINLNDRRVDGTTGVIELAHQKGLMVHAYTFRDDASGYGFKDPKVEMQAYFKLGLDGLFTDFTETGVAARNGL